MRVWQRLVWPAKQEQKAERRDNQGSGRHANEYMRKTKALIGRQAAVIVHRRRYRFGVVNIVIVLQRWHYSTCHNWATSGEIWQIISLTNAWS